MLSAVRFSAPSSVSSSVSSSISSSISSRLHLLLYLLCHLLFLLHFFIFSGNLSGCIVLLYLPTPMWWVYGDHAYVSFNMSSWKLEGQFQPVVYSGTLCLTQVVSNLLQVIHFEGTQSFKVHFLLFAIWYAWKQWVDFLLCDFCPWFSLFRARMACCRRIRLCWIWFSSLPRSFSSSISAVSNAGIIVRFRLPQVVSLRSIYILSSLVISTYRLQMQFFDICLTEQDAKTRKSFLIFSTAQTGEKKEESREQKEREK